ncbi:hypothetical protein EVAR_56899_1 [Eumeta japonica]|uniref:Uncharacterized protein n=1 Tax=Eumeta variegata TaxID=151549 RepID=A0A4C1YEK5_EUMVA|nr:hypothetical protein EVAR_56899_1 [Eumeta japonica]
MRQGIILSVIRRELPDRRNAPRSRPPHTPRPLCTQIVRGIRHRRGEKLRYRYEIIHNLDNEHLTICLRAERRPSLRGPVFGGECSDLRYALEGPRQLLIILVL